jgi:plastocyanin
MSLKYVYIGCVLAAVSGATATAAVVEIGVGGYYFSPQFPVVQPGDTIRWIHEGGTHDVTSGAPCDGDSGLFFSQITVAVPQFEWTVPASFDGEVIPYYCSVGNHCVSGDQFGALLVNVQPHYVTTNGFVYEPPSITVDAGDVVFWLHAGGTHTVTSGIGCTSDGRFDNPLSNFDPIPYYVVPEDEPSGTIDYYCTPHCDLGMVGTIDVMGTDDCPGDINGDGVVGVDDLLELLAVYGNSCSGCSEDVNGDGVIGVDDLLELLAVYGADC